MKGTHSSTTSFHFESSLKGENEGGELQYGFLSFLINFESKNEGRDLRYDILSFWIDSERKMKGTCSSTSSFISCHFLSFWKQVWINCGRNKKGESSITTSFHFKSILKGKWGERAPLRLLFDFFSFWIDFQIFWKKDNTSLLQRNPSQNLSKTKICAAKKPTVYPFYNAILQNLCKTKVFGAKELAVHHFCNANPSKT